MQSELGLTLAAHSLVHSFTAAYMSTVIVAFIKWGTLHFVIVSMYMPWTLPVSIPLWMHFQRWKVNVVSFSRSSSSLFKLPTECSAIAYIRIKTCDFGHCTLLDLGKAKVTFAEHTCCIVLC